MSIEALVAISMGVLYIGVVLWAWYKVKDRTKTKEPEISDMTEVELSEAMVRLGTRYRAMSDLLKERNSVKLRGVETYEGFMSRNVVRSLIKEIDEATDDKDDDEYDAWDNGLVG